MSVLQASANIKIPYPTEGVIRTAQLDDTVAPENSVQLAVNVNFDRVGATQTRPGVTAYADALAEAINSYGTLRNALIPPGYRSLFQLGLTSDIEDEAFDDPSAVRVSADKIAVFWSGVDNLGYCRNFAVDEATGDVTPLGTTLVFEATNCSRNRAILVSDSVVVNCWSGSGSDGFANGFNVSGDSITAGTPYEFDAADGTDFSLAQVDSTHLICFYRGTSSDGLATIFAVDTGTLAVTEPGATLTFDSGSVQNNSCVALGDGTHFVNFWSDPTTATVRCFAVNTGTWAITALSTALTFSSGSRHNALSTGDGSHVWDVYKDASGKLGAKCFAVNLSTFAVTAVGTPLSGDTVSNDLVAVGFGDGYHAVAFYAKSLGDGYAQMIALDSSTFAATAVGDPLVGYDFASANYTAAVALATNKVAAVWGNVGGQAGEAAVFQSFGAVVSGRWLYAGHGDEVSNAPGATGTWTTRRSGLAEVSRPRFAQFLGYLWMVNGNEQIGGDPVATSDGGAFGTDLVPDGFPAGDLIQGGFEGRVWVANSTLGVIYYTDIVQFIPPLTYALSYDPAVNYISTISPQTGQTMTALFEVPRALLVFTEDTITRIYGASSIDAYPAYNVGTYSQESIVQTKTGIFFHHSSGFYQFDYGSQPVEISRRIVDFVKAIPRAYYSDVTGVYDGFDAVEWSVGPVTVEGVTFSSCVLRYTISTQVWTVYDYVGNAITAMVPYDDGTTLRHLAGTEAGDTGALDTGTTDFGEPFYYEVVDRWRPFAPMYYQVKSISGVSVYAEGAGGANVTYQAQGATPNVWLPIGSVDEDAVSLLPNVGTEDFNVVRLRIAGTTSGTPIVFHGIEITQLTVKGQDSN